ncbi:hypothetical protein GGI07_001111 [Coemansia sp. Benny D115]|nr:hypothetical protein GGI07_001111 [Coemansia sp. Benny D115]
MELDRREQQSRERQNSDGLSLGRGFGDERVGAQPFPAVVWPLRSGGPEDRVYDTIGVAACSGILPAVRAGKVGEWLTQNALTDACRPVRAGTMLQAATRMPGLLDAPTQTTGTSLASMVGQFETLHAEIDVSRTLLTELLEEGVRSGAQTHFASGNATAVCCNLAGTELALFAGGEARTQLWAKNLQSEASTKVLELTTPVRQICTRRAHSGIALLRTDSMAGLVRLGSLTDARPAASRIAGYVYDYGCGDARTCHAAWSPWMASEAALASANGTVRLWDFGTASEVLIESAEDHATAARQWTSCDYLGSPRVLFKATAAALTSIDARAQRCRSLLLDVAQAPFVYANEAITAAVSCTHHPMHVAAASSRALRIVDRRFARQPILAWTVEADTSPAHLVSGVKDGRGILLLATRGARVGVFECEAPHIDAPYVSCGQTILAMPPSPVHARQDALAIESLTDSPILDMALEGLALHMRADGSSLCVATDELGRVAALPIHPPAEGRDALPLVPTRRSSSQAHNARREATWSQIRHCGAPYERIDLHEVYAYLVGHPGSQAPETDPAPKSPSASASAPASASASASALVPSSRPISASDTIPEGSSAYVLSQHAIARLAPQPKSLHNALPSWTPAGTRIRNAALQAAEQAPPKSIGDLVASLSASALIDEAPACSSSSSSSEQDRPQQALLDALAQLFPPCSRETSTLAQQALDRAATDATLCAKSVRTDTTQAPELSGLASHARLLQMLWDDPSLSLWGETTAARRPRQTHQQQHPTPPAASRANPRTTLTQLPQVARGAETQPAALFYSQPTPALDAFSLASVAPPVAAASVAATASQRQARLSLSQKAKKKKSRKSGF